MLLNCLFKNKNIYVILKHSRKKNTLKKSLNYFVCQYHDKQTIILYNILKEFNVSLIIYLDIGYYGLKKYNDKIIFVKKNYYIYSGGEIVF
jgi:hypothetical protein